MTGRRGRLRRRIIAWAVGLVVALVALQAALALALPALGGAGWRAALLCVLGLVLGLLWGILLARQLARPLDTLAASARALGSGDLAHRVPATSDPTGLADALNAMAEGLERERARLESARAAAAELYDGLPDPSCVIDADSELVLRCNRALCELLGKSREAVLGAPARELFPEDSHDEARRVLEACLARGVAERVSLAVRTLDGSLREVAVGLVPVRDPTGRVGQLRSTWWEIGGLVADRRALQRAKDQLELALRNRTRELEAARRELQRFASVASHDLRAPLRAVSSFCELLEAEYSPQLDDDARQYIRFAVEGARGMGRLIDDLLAFARAGQNPPQREDCDVAAVVSRLRGELRERLAESGAEISHGALPSVRADPEMLALILRHMFGNALRYRSPARPPRIELGVEDAGGLWRFRVEDNGQGIVEEDLLRIFQPFIRGRNRAADKGAGLGLAICQRLVELHGGTIAVSSVRDEGSVFTFSVAQA